MLWMGSPKVHAVPEGYALLRMTSRKGKAGSVAS
jgi:hypothetical protein